MKFSSVFCPKCTVLIIGVFISFSVAKSNPDSAAFAPLRAAVSHVPEWTEQTNEYKFFTAKGLYGIIDGAAADHDKQGLKNGIGLSLTGFGKSLDIYFENFGSAARAAGMVEIKKKSLSSPKPFPQTKALKAIYDDVIGGCMVFWAKSNYYVEMTLTGYDSLGKALGDAGTFIDSISPAILDSKK
jgi:hypothetical protein